MRFLTSSKKKKKKKKKKNKKKKKKNKKKNKKKKKKSAILCKASLLRWTWSYYKTQTKQQYSVILVILLSSLIKLVKMSRSWFFMHVFPGLSRI